RHPIPKKRAKLSCHLESTKSANRHHPPLTRHQPPKPSHDKGRRGFHRGALGSLVQNGIRAAASRFALLDLSSSLLSHRNVARNRVLVGVHHRVGQKRGDTDAEVVDHRVAADRNRVADRADVVVVVVNRPRAPGVRLSRSGKPHTSEHGSGDEELLEHLILPIDQNCSHPPEMRAITSRQPTSHEQQANTREGNLNIYKWTLSNKSGHSTLGNRSKTPTTNRNPWRTQTSPPFPSP